jgi:hypothetical protein
MKLNDINLNSSNLEEQEHIHDTTVKAIITNEKSLNVKKLQKSDLKKDVKYRIAHSEVDPGNTYVFPFNKDYKSLKKQLFLDYLEKPVLTGDKIFFYMEETLGWGDVLANPKLNIKYIP